MFPPTQICIPPFLLIISSIIILKYSYPAKCRNFMIANKPFKYAINYIQTD